ncbi:MAG TPA: hypothetical protein DDW27_13710 [Bacteroidales bacterium]|nr:hypothetical protein [Bacteroidales bacterium]
MHKTFQFDFIQLGLTVSQVQEDMGYRKELPDTTVTDLISEVLSECETLGGIKAEYRIFDNVEFDRQTKSVMINNIVFDINKTVFGQISNSESIAVFLCTAGEEPAIRSGRAMMEGDLLKGYVYDIIGSELVGAAAELLQNELDRSVTVSGLKTTNQFNPGYCGWNVTEQHKLFRLIPDNFCGIRLTESALMDPVKSASGFIGIGKNVKRVPYTCSFCGMTDCFYRRGRT